MLEEAGIQGNPIYLSNTGEEIPNLFFHYHGGAEDIARIWEIPFTLLLNFHLFLLCMVLTVFQLGKLTDDKDPGTDFEQSSSHNMWTRLKFEKNVDLTNF